MTQLRILNSQSRQKEDFTPLSPQRVTMYTCGPTVYDSLHLGHARAAITPDIVRRYLEYKGYNVRYVMNFTDVDDKIIKKAIEQNCDYREITAKYIDEFHRVMLSLNVKPADVFPRATDHIPEMIAIVEKLFAKNHAYAASDGDIYFDTTTYARYGALSGRKLDEEEAGLSGRISSERMAVKKNQGDFVLWKLNKNDKEEIAKGADGHGFGDGSGSGYGSATGDGSGAAIKVPGWQSPWGRGRPGWHLECSAMSHAYLGVPFDIHCGGQDLLFPHHEDEKAQTECAYCEELKNAESVKYWVHNAFVNVARSKMMKEGGVAVSLVRGVDMDADTLAQQGLLDATTDSVKMSKSLGNVKWLREMIWPEGPYDPMAVRMMLLSSHYRSPIVFEPAMLEEATARLERIYNTLETTDRIAATTRMSIPPFTQRPPLGANEPWNLFHISMDDDFNTAGALAAVFEMVARLNRVISIPDPIKSDIEAMKNVVIEMLTILGIRPTRAKAVAAGDSDKLVDLLMQTRLDARAAKQYPLGDKIRDGLKGLGYEVEDLPGGKWAVKKK